MIAVFDIDGVLADATHRQHHVERRPKDWDAFFAAVGGDSTIAAGLALLRELGQEHEIVLLSGRPERTRTATEEWLRTHDVRYQRLLLRRDTDRRPARVFKAEAVRRLGPVEEVVVVIDDDDEVVAELTRRGHPAALFA